MSNTKYNYNERNTMMIHLGQMKSEFSSWRSTYQDISNYLSPRAGRYFISDRNRGERRNRAIYDSTATKDLRVLGAGMQSGGSSPARPWFRLAIGDKQMMRRSSVKLWLSDVTGLMLSVFAKSNTYGTLHQMYEELGGFGTAASFVMDDFNNVIHHYPMTTGEFMIATNFRGEVSRLYREFEKTVFELVGEFGYKNCSNTVKSLYDTGSYGTWVPIIQAVEPRDVRDLTKRDAKNMPFKSCFFELGDDKGGFLRESGFKTFPALCPRWQVTGGDVYGDSPGQDAIGDIKQLQHQQLRKAQAIDYKTTPPLQVPTHMKNREVEIFPGGTTYVDSSGSNGGVKTLFDTTLDLSHLLADIQDVRQRIHEIFYRDLFLMLSSQDTTRMTATEVAERHEEKLVVLGPVLERLHKELLSPLIDMTFQRLLAAGVLPPPPEELHGQELNVEFISVLAQAQRAIATNGVDRFVMSLGTIAQGSGDVSVWDKFDKDEWADVYSDMLGVPPELIVADNKVALIRQNRAQGQQAAQAAALAESGANTAKNLSQANTGGQNALTDVMNMFSGYTT